jgi:alpha-galactosidase
MKGWSSWNAIGSTVSAEYIKKVADYMVSSGLATKGFKYCNVDEGWMIGRDDTTLMPIHDPTSFPGKSNNSGMKDLGDYVHSKGLLYGVQ